MAIDLQTLLKTLEALVATFPGLLTTIEAIVAALSAKQAVGCDGGSCNCQCCDAVCAEMDKLLKHAEQEIVIALTTKKVCCSCCEDKK